MPLPPSPNHGRKQLVPSTLKAPNKNKLAAANKASKASTIRKPLTVNLSDSQCCLGSPLKLPALARLFISIMGPLLFMHFRIFNNKKRSSLYATAVYASPSASGKKFLWPHLERIASTIRGPWIAFGDFNTTLGPPD
ncbi:hypothetical protein V6N13_064048 [Hibiscus sabdariffa]